MSTLLALLFSSLTVFSINAFEYDSSNCGYYHDLQGTVQFYRQNPASDLCWLSVLSESGTLVYRSYLFGAHDGLFMVFNSYGRGPSATHTGARVYHIFPRNQVPDVKVVDDDLFILTSNQNVTFKKNTLTGRWTGSSTGAIREATQIVRNNQGGVEISGQAALILDSGFLMGQDVRTMDRVSTFKDHLGNTCSVPNVHLFDYGDSGSIDLKFKTDAELATFLKSKCPRISQRYLN